MTFREGLADEDALLPFEPADDLFDLPHDLTEPGLADGEVSGATEAERELCLHVHFDLRPVSGHGFTDADPRNLCARVQHLAGGTQGPRLFDYHRDFGVDDDAPGFIDEEEPGDNRLVFVYVRKTSQDSQVIVPGVVPGSGPVIRLQGLDACEVARSKAVKRPLTAARVTCFNVADPLALLRINREGVVPTWSLVVVDDELPDQVIQSTSEIVDQISDEGTPLRRWLCSLAEDRTEDVGRGWFPVHVRIEASPRIFGELVELGIESIPVFLRAVELEAYSMDVNHG